MFNLIVANMYKHHLIELRLFSKSLCSGTVMLVTREKLLVTFDG